MSAARRSEPTYAWEKIDQLLASGFEDLLAIDWEEMEQPSGEPPLAVNWPHARQLERQGMLKALAVRVSGRLVGYNVFFLHPTLNYRSTVWAMNNAIWLAPEHRKLRTGVTLVTRAYDDLIAMGATKVIYHARPERLGLPASHARLGRLLAKLGYAMEEEVWVRRA